MEEKEVLASKQIKRQTKKEENNVDVTTAPVEPAVMTLAAFVSSEGLTWQAESRLKHLMNSKQVPGEMSLEDWKKVLARI